MLLFFRDRFHTNGKTTFSQGELSLILGLYGSRVQRGEWRDYAIDHLPDMAVFSIFKSTKEQPIYAIAKKPSRTFLKPPHFTVYAGPTTLREGQSLRQVLQFFDEDEKT